MNEIRAEAHMSLKDVAAYTGYAVNYLYKLVAMGKIPCYRPTGKRLVFRRSEIDVFMSQGRQAADYEYGEGLSA